MIIMMAKYLFYLFSLFKFRLETNRPYCSVFPDYIVFNCGNLKVITNLNCILEKLTQALM